MPTVLVFKPDVSVLTNLQVVLKFETIILISNIYQYFNKALKG